MQVEEPGEAEGNEPQSNSQQEQAVEIDQVLESALDSTGDAASEQPLDVDARVAAADREVLRAKAELENFRKRMQRESETQLKYAYMPMMRDLLEVVDNLQRAMEAAKEDGAKIESLREGVEMVNQQLVGVLGKHGCSKIDALGQPFDPNIHEAIAQMPSDEHEKGNVMQDVAVGYLLHDRVVRPSNVIVSSGPAE